MNSLEKIFNSIKNAPSKELKLHSVKELIKQLKEYDEYILYMLKSIYQLLTSDDTLNRICGAKILSKMAIFEYSLNFQLSSVKASDYVYLQFKDIKEDEIEKNKAKQKSAIKKTLALEHIEADFLENIELEKNSIDLKHKTAEYKEKAIENIYDFFEAVNLIVLSPDWFKRHGGFLAYCAMIASSDPSDDFNIIMDGLSTVKPTIQSEVNAVDKLLNNISMDKSLNTIPMDKSAKREDRIKIKLSGDLFNKIFEILKNDKFNDFQDDITSSPVRESASLLLKYIYPLLNNDLILFEITHLLTSNEWQEQFSGLIALSHLKEYFSEKLIKARIFEKGSNTRDKYTLVDLLIDLLDSYDEDVKYLSADLLNDIIFRFVEIKDEKIDKISEKCWEQIESEADIAHSKASLIILLKTIYGKFSLTPPESFTSLYPCFTSSIHLIRNSVLELSKIFEGSEFLYLLGESILLEPHKEENHCCRIERKSPPKSFDILKGKIKGSLFADLKDFGNHFLKIIGFDINLPYNEDDFGCYEETFFTRDGIKSIGNTHNLNNRTILFSLIYQIKDIALPVSSTLLGLSFNSLYTHQMNTGLLTGNKVLNDSKVLTDGKALNDSKEEIVKKIKVMTDLKDILIGSIDKDFKRYSSLKRMPIKEFKAMIEDPFYYSLYPLCYDYCLEYIRMIACFHLFSTIIDFSLYFILESSIEFFRIFSKTVLISESLEHIAGIAWKLLINLHKEREDLETSRRNNELFLKMDSKKKKGTGNNEISEKSYKEIIIEQGITNLTVFFSILGHRLLQFNLFGEIMNSSDRLLFFQHTIQFYLNTDEISKISILKIFNDALEQKNVKILKEFLSDIEFNSLFVRHILDSFDIPLLARLLDYSDPSFNVVFVKPILKSANKYGSEQGLLSKVICSVHFTPNPRIKDEYLLNLIEREKTEVQMIVDPTLIKEYEIKVNMSIQLRGYQKEGIKWISFLSRFNLNGILADDMGLGKTVQVLTFLVNEMHATFSLATSSDLNTSKPLLMGLDTNQTSATIKTPSDVDQASATIKGQSDVDQVSAMGQSNIIAKQPQLKSLILCPSSLSSHWKDELEKVFNVKSTIYELKKPSLFSDITICSYDSFRRDGFLENIDWFMIIFDEGHVLKNRSTILYTKVKKLRSEKRIILTGTPVHNSVEDIFSLFDIIMPNYLGTESEFLSLYNCKINDKNVKVMEDRLDSLHKKTLPFIMRRLKSDVLKDLPPKIIKDLVVELNPSQMELYTKIKQGEQKDSTDETQELNYNYLKNTGLTKMKDLLKAASHPHYFDTSILSSKTSALQDIFTMCGGENVQRKILIFFQFKHTIDFVIEELKLTNYLRLDGTIPVDRRGSIVSRFNSEAIPYLFLTTSIGGLGLNLTSADTVVFYEHDWNPFNDLQAMDRAHRLGQKNVVNVFRLISKSTIEEKVMNYQNFKLYVANTLITQQNNEIVTMDTKDILERFQ